MNELYFIFLRDICMDVSIGIHDFERASSQPMEFSVVLLLSKDAKTRDDIKDVVNYDLVRDILARLVSKGHWDLQESLCTAVLSEVENIDGVHGVIIKSAKTSVYADTKSVGCHMARLGPDMEPNFPWWTIHV